jgi:hypothetical protein
MSENNAVPVKYSQFMFNNIPEAMMQTVVMMWSILETRSALAVPRSVGIDFSPWVLSNCSSCRA